MVILTKAQKMLEKYPLCNHCLGRQFALLGYELDNEERGKTIKVLLTMKGNLIALQEKQKGIMLLKTLAGNGSTEMATKVLAKMGIEGERKRECYLCEGRFTLLHELAENSIEKMNGYEYNTFLVGVKLPLQVEEREDEFKAGFKVQHGENIRNEFSREIGKRILHLTKREVDFKTPDIVVIINPFQKQVHSLQVNPLYIEGRYQKLARGILLYKKLCSKCGGKGCPTCNWTGKGSERSIEEYISTPILDKTQGDDAIFHTAGGEDINTRVLGEGRPFIIEIKRPKKRFLNLAAFTEIINNQSQGKVEAHNLQPVSKESISQLKKRTVDKISCELIIEFENNISDEKVGLLENNLTATVIRQKTPSRILHRSTDRFREKYIYEIKITRLTQNRVKMKLHHQGGLYIKELVTGDEGRTEPNVSEIVAMKANPQELDIFGVV